MKGGFNARSAIVFTSCLSFPHSWRIMHTDAAHLSMLHLALMVHVASCTGYAASPWQQHFVGCQSSITIFAAC